MDIKLMPEKYKEKGIGGDLKELPRIGLSKIFGQVSSQGSLWFTLSIVLLVLVVLSCFGLWGYKINLNKEIDNLAQRFEELESQRNPELETSFAELKEKVDSFKSILAKRVYFLNTLKMLEELTLTQVHYTDFTADLKKAALSLGIQATSYNILAKQIAVFEDDSRIGGVEFSEVGLEKSGWVSSELDIKLNLGFLYSN